jgi:hypothetical protein
MDHLWPCPASTLYPTSKGGWLSTLRTVLPGSFLLVTSSMRRLWRRLQGAESDVKIHRINERIHWSVRERCSWPVTLVDGVGKVKYAPRNLGSSIDVAEPTALEWRLLDRSRLWEGRCPLEEEGATCQCSERPATRIGRMEPPAAAA